MLSLFHLLEYVSFRDINHLYADLADFYKGHSFSNCFNNFVFIFVFSLITTLILSSMLIILFLATSNLPLPVPLWIYYICNDTGLNSVWFFWNLPFHPKIHFIISLLRSYFTESVSLLCSSNTIILLQEFPCTWIVSFQKISSSAFDMLWCIWVSLPVIGNVWVVTMTSVLWLSWTTLSTSSTRTTCYGWSPLYTLLPGTHLSFCKGVWVLSTLYLIFKNQVIPILFKQLKLQRKMDPSTIHFIKVVYPNIKHGREKTKIDFAHN